MKQPNSKTDIFVKKALRFQLLAKGSLALITKPCIRPDCAACREGVKHKAYIYTFYKEGKKRTMYVPLGLVSVMREALSNGRKLESLLVDAGVAIIKDYRYRRDRKAR